jgi:hypothetical protein
MDISSNSGLPNDISSNSVLPIAQQPVLEPSPSFSGITSSIDASPSPAPADANNNLDSLKALEGSTTDAFGTESGAAGSIARKAEVSPSPSPPPSSDSNGTPQVRVSGKSEQPVYVGEAPKQRRTITLVGFISASFLI